MSLVGGVDDSGAIFVTPSSFREIKGAFAVHTIKEESFCTNRKLFFSLKVKSEETSPVN